MKILFKNISSLVTVNANSQLYKIAKQMQDVGEIKDAAMLVSDKILWIGTSQEADNKLQNNEIECDKIIDMKGKTILPGFCDSHTHIVFAGDRSDEFVRRLRGVSYQQIAEEGGGIQSTVKATRAASLEELTMKGLKLAKSAIRYGTTAIEIKSGYSLNTEGEIKQLRAIKNVQSELKMHVSSTFLGAHDMPLEYRDNRQKYVDLICKEMIPQISSENLAEFCDAFIDKGYYTLAEGEQILQAGLDFGMKLKVHCDELADVDSAQLAANLGAVSADHLLCVNDNGIESLRKSGTVAGLLPGTAYFIRMPYAPARKIIDSNVITCLATDCNPGSCFTENMQMILSLSVINMAMTAEEAICASTLNGAYSIRQSDKMGSLEIGKLANFVVYDVPKYSDIFYNFAINHVEQTWIQGELVYNNSMLG